MRFDVVIESVAGAQLLEAALWYNEKRSGLGEELILCFEEAVDVLSRNPFFEVRYRNLRIYNIKRFPYQIVYLMEVEHVKIVAFFHASRDPKEWKKLYKR